MVAASACGAKARELSMKRRLLAVLAGVGVTLGGWTLRGTDATRAAQEGIPAQVWTGGVPVTLEAELSGPGKVHAFFEHRSPVDSEDHRMMEVWQSVPEGLHSFNLDVPPGTQGSVFVTLEAPVVSSKVRVSLRAGDKVLTDESTLERAPAAGEGFFAGLELEDWTLADVE